MLSLSKKSISPWFSWSIVAIIFLTQYGLLVSPSAITHQLCTSLDCSVGDIGIFSSAFLYTWVLMQIPAGLLFDHFNSQKLLFYSTLILALACVVQALSQNFTLGILSRLLMGFGGSFSFVGALYLGRNWFSLATFPIIVGLTEAVSGIGEIGYGAMFAALKDYYSWRIIMLVIAIFIIILAIMVLLFVHDKQSPSVKKQVNVWIDLKQTVRNKKLLLLALYMGFGVVHYIVLADMWGIHGLIAHYHITILKAIFLNSFVIIGFTAGCPILGYISRFFVIRRVILICSILEIGLLAINNFMNVSIQWNYFLLFFLGFVTSAVILSFDLAELFIPKKSFGVATGLINMFFGGISVLLMPVVGYLFQERGHYINMGQHLVFAATSISLIFAIIINCHKDFHLKRTPVR
ncbi:MAG: MFS transporter [Gammaproteobacteria bacterium]|nr:MFS transporter [Gammaproteobacteria bacterium]